MSLNLLLVPNNLGPFYVNPLILTIPVTFTGAYTGGTGRLFLTKAGNMVTLALVQDTTAVTTGGGTINLAAGTIPSDYRCTSTALQYPAVVLNNTSQRLAGIVSVKSDGSMIIDSLLVGFTIGAPAGLLNSFSCSYMTTQ